MSWEEHKEEGQSYKKVQSKKGVAEAKVIKKNQSLGQINQNINSIDTTAGIVIGSILTQ